MASAGPEVDEDDEPMSPAVVAGGGAGGAAGATPASASASASASSAHRGHIGLEGKTGGIPLHQYRRAGAGGVGAGGGAGVTATRGSSGTVGGGAASASASASSRAAHPGYERWREELEPGDPVDVLDTVHKWSAAQVIKAGADSVMVHFVFWTSRWDEWISRASPRLAPAQSRIYVPGGPVRPGQRVDIFDRHPNIQKWTEGNIVRVMPGKAVIHFHGYGSKFDETHDVPFNPDLIQPYGAHTKKKRGYRPKASEAWANKKRERVVKRETDHWTEYCQGLAKLGFRVQECEGDGNCLFRAVSDQVYGTQAHHALVRAKTIEYMRAHRNFFQPFVAWDMASFNKYLAYKAQNAVWGDDPEIQAMCEMYNRPAHLWSHHPDYMARRLRTFHAPEGRADTRPPIMLSYYGGGHYDSVVRLDGVASHLKTAPGVHENSTITQAKAAADGSALQAALSSSRELLDNHDDSVEDQLRRLWAASDSVTTDATLEAVKDITATQADADAIRIAKEESAAAAAQADLDAAILEESRRQAEEDRIREALEASRLDGSGGGGGGDGAAAGSGTGGDVGAGGAGGGAGAAADDNADLDDVIEQSRRDAEQEQMRAAMAASLADAGGVVSGASHGAIGGDDDDLDPEQAMLMMLIAEQQAAAGPAPATADS